MYYISLVFYFIGFGLSAQALALIVWPERTAFREQLGFYENSWRVAHGELREKLPADAAWPARIKDLAVRFISRALAAEFIQTRLVAADVAIDWTEFVYYHLVGATAAGIVVYLLAGPAPAIATVAACGWLPFGWLDYLTARRRKLFAAQLPDTLTMLAGSLKAGYSLAQAVDMVADETVPPMSTEFKKVLADSGLGLPVEQAFEKMGLRVANMSFDWMVLAIKIQREVGGNLSEVLATLAGTIRARETVLGQIRVLTAEGRLSALILLCLPVFVTAVLYLLNPGYMGLMFTNLAGVVMLVAAVGLMAVGALWLRQVVRIEV